MHINTIFLKNFRGFSEKQFEFNDQFNVLIGDNGTGKTAILEGIAAAISPFLYGFESRNLRPLKKDDIRYLDYKLSREQSIGMGIEATGIINNKSLSWSITREKRDWGFVKENTSELKSTSKEMLLKVSQNTKVVLPVFAYHGTGRLWKESVSKVNPKAKGSRLEGYNQCLDPNSGLKDFSRWMKTMEMAFLQNTIESFYVETIQKAIAKCLEGWDNVYYDIREDELMAENGKRGQGNRLPYHLLSDGQKNIIGMVADIAWRCITLNPDLGRDATKESPGIVLVDELDLHLHPNWQRHIVNDLKTTFPKIQFVVTTHSPFIVQSLKSEELINLDNASALLDEDPDRYSIEEISAQEMGVSNVERSETFLKMQDEAKEFFALIKSSNDNTAIKKAKAKLDELRMRYNNDPAYVALLESELPKENS